MKYLTITTLIVFALGTMLIFVDQQGSDSFNRMSSLGSRGWMWQPPKKNDAEKDHPSFSIRGVGEIEGTKEATELRSRIPEQIREVHIARGMWVSAGDLLISLDADNLKQERDLAAAMLELAVAKKRRLEKGARASEIEAAKQDYQSQLGPLWSAERALKRGEKLLQDNAIGEQDLDELQANVESLRATAAAALARLKTVELPAHVDDLAAANAEVQAARSRLEIAQIRLERSQIKAPIEGCVLDVNARIGELTGPNAAAPLVVIADNRQLHAVAEVDEFDALKVKLGQKCEITTDAHEGIIAEGTIVEIEPQMDRKRMVGQWAGERNDTFSRKIRIALESSVEELPIGLPIEISIQTAEK
jgi:multidrug resistance efflux pump